MKIITKKEYMDIIREIKDCGKLITVAREIADLGSGKSLYIVFGYSDAYEQGDGFYHQTTYGDTIYTLCAKLSVSGNNLSGVHDGGFLGDYDEGWDMPMYCGYYCDTDFAVPVDIDGDIIVYNREAAKIVELYNKGRLTI